MWKLIIWEEDQKRAAFINEYYTIDSLFVDLKELTREYVGLIEIRHQ